MNTPTSQPGFNTNIATRRSPLAQHLTKFITYTALALITTIALIIITQHILALILPLALYSAWLTQMAMYDKSGFMKEFSDLNNLQYTPSGRPSHYDGRPFHYGYDRIAHDIVAGDLQDRPFELFLYQYTTGSGRNQQTMKLTVLTVELGRLVPNIYAECRDSGITPTRHTGLRLPNPSYQAGLLFNNRFDNYYHLQTDENEQREAPPNLRTQSHGTAHQTTLPLRFRAPLRYPLFVLPVYHRL